MGMGEGREGRREEGKWRGKEGEREGRESDPLVLLC